MTLLFKPITIEDKELISSYTLNSDYQNCDFSFANMCSWQFVYDSEFAIIEDFLVIRFWIENKRRPAYMMPVGTGNLAQVIALMEQDSERLGHPLCLMGICPVARKRLEGVLPEDFHCIPDRDYYDYIYKRTDLAKLEGKKYQAKRNHVNKFRKQYVYEYVTLTSDMAKECLELECEWFLINRLKFGEDVEEMGDERSAMQYCFNNFEQLGLIGGAITIDGKIVAFTYASPINGDTLSIHVEKGNVDYEGIYQIINQEFALHLPEHYVYVNREEDMGLSGLRKSKMSYLPFMLLEKNIVIKKPISLIVDQNDKHSSANRIVENVF